MRSVKTNNTSINNNNKNQQKRKYNELDSRRKYYEPELSRQKSNCKINEKVLLFSKQNTAKKFKKISTTRNMFDKNIECQENVDDDEDIRDKNGHKKQDLFFIFQ